MSLASVNRSWHSAESYLLLPNSGQGTKITSASLQNKIFAIFIGECKRFHFR